ncbi:hypothetical protein DSECCO2_625090 [anaerobic digester metagenome]
MAQARRCRREPVGGHLHDEGRRFSPEDGAPEEFCRHDGDDDPENIEEEDHPSRPGLEECAGKEDVHGEPRAAGHERVDQDRYQPVFLTLDRPRGHDRGNVAPEPDQHRNERFPGQSESMQGPIHDERGTRQVAGILEDRKDQEEYEDVGQEDEDGADTADDAVADERAKPGGFDRAGCKPGKPCDERIDHGHEGSRDRKRQLERSPHQRKKDRDTEVPVGDDAVDHVRECRTFRVSAVDLRQDGGDRLVALVRHHGLVLVGVDGREDTLHADGGRTLPDLRYDILIPLEEFDGEPAEGIALGKVPVGRKGIHERHDLRLRIVAVADGMLVVRRGLCLLDCGFEEGVKPLAPGSDRAHDRDLEELRKPRPVDGVALRFGHIGHVQGDDDRDPEFRELRRQVEVPLQVRRVHDLDDDVRLLVEEEVPRDDLVCGVRGQAVGAGKVDDLDLVAVTADPAGLLLHGHPGPVPDVLPRTGQCVKERRLADVGVAGECDPDFSRHATPFAHPTSIFIAIPLDRAYRASPTETMSEPRFAHWTFTRASGQKPIPKRRACIPLPARISATVASVPAERRASGQRSPVISPPPGRLR